MVDANDSSRSDDKNSSTSSRGRWNRWLRLREGAAGGAERYWVDGANKAIWFKSNRGDILCFFCECLKSD